jgi:uroporphyrinogen III methyltransferase/synthase
MSGGAPAPARPGLVSLVGAGPGDPGLLTVRGRQALERADVVLYDHLASPALLAGVARAGQERIHVGKSGGPGRAEQARIDELIVRRARAGQRVVRLKGGDPFVFGRGGEEAEACAAAGVPFEVIPGVSSVTAVPAYAGIPITHRDLASGFTVLTGHERWDARAERVDWGLAAGQGGTVLVLMGVLQVARWSAGLMVGGRSPATPVALVRWGTTPRQQTLESTLGEVAEAVAAARFKPPAVAIVGDVVRLRARLAWFDRRPLFGQVVALTRSAAGDEEAFAALAELGAEIVHVPLTRQRTLDLAPLGAAIARGDATDVAFSSANGVRAFADALRSSGRDARWLAGRAVWAIGQATAAALVETLCVRADHLPGEAATAAAMVALAETLGVAGRRVLLPAAAAARPTLARGLTALGAHVEELPCYQTVPDEAAAARLLDAVERGLTLVTLASPSAVDAFVAAGPGLTEIPVAAIGPTTAEAAAARGLTVAVTAADHSMAGLAAAIIAHASTP